MKISKKFTDPNLTNEQRDQIMEDLLKSKFDSQLRDKYKTILSKEHGLSRSDGSTVATQSAAESESKNTKGKLYLVIGVVLALVALSLALFFSKGNGTEAVQTNKAQMYLAELSIDNKNVTRNSNDQRAPALIAATKAFNDGNYAEAIKQYALVDQLDNENLFFRSVANMKLGKYAEAENGFKVLQDQIKNGEAFKSETHVYLLLCLKLQNKDAEAASLAAAFKAGSWEAKEAQKLMK